MSPTTLTLLPTLQGPKDLRKLPIDALPELCKELRQVICEQVSASGGHLAPNLGVVELTVALHYVFDFAHDRLLFDVGHQCYPHKLLTGRLGLMSKLRQKGGMAGFPEPLESDYDLFAVGHAGTAISTAVGMARGDDLIAGGVGKSDRRAVAIVGDASIVNGVALEGLNNAGTLHRQFLTILNDNGMSIAKPQGAMAAYFDRVRVSPTYADLKRKGKRVLSHLPGGSVIEEVYHRGGEVLKAMISTGHLFEDFGHVCVGPIDGHDLPWLIEVFRELHSIPRPVLLHVKTIKGKGFAFAENDATKFHSPAAFTIHTDPDHTVSPGLEREGCRVEIKTKGRSFTTAYADAMIDIMQRDEKVVAVTAAMPDGTGLNKVMPRFPHRTFDTGICESHAMDMCAGMAKSGLRPFFAVYSTFSQRALDQVFQEVALQGLAVRVCMDRAGFVGGDGAVHHGFMDISMFRTLPGAVLLAPSDEPTLIAALEFMRTYDAGATFIRYPRDNVAVSPVQVRPAPYELGKAVCVKHVASPDVAILAYGTMVYPSLEAAETLEKQGRSVAVYDARFAKPVDAALIKSLLTAGLRTLTVEDHFATAGFGSAVLESAQSMHLDTRLLGRLGMPERWVGQDSRSSQLRGASLDPAGITHAALALLDAQPQPGPAVKSTVSV